MLRYFTRKDSEYIKKNGELVHEKIRIIHSDGKNVVVEDDGDIYKIPIEYIDDTLDLFNMPYNKDIDLDKRLIRDFNITDSDMTTPFSIFSQQPLQTNSKDFFRNLFQEDSIEEVGQFNPLKRKGRKSRKKIPSNRKLIVKRNKTSKIKN
jgi:hypothetical protein